MDIMMSQRRPAGQTFCWVASFSLVLIFQVFTLTFSKYLEETILAGPKPCHSGWCLFPLQLQLTRDSLPFHWHKWPILFLGFFPPGLWEAVASRPGIRVSVDLAEPWWSISTLPGRVPYGIWGGHISQTISLTWIVWIYTQPKRNFSEPWFFFTSLLDFSLNR